MRNRSLLRAAIVAGALLTAGRENSFAQQRFIPLGFLPGTTGSIAYGVSNTGFVVGVSDGVAFRWHPATGMQALEYPNAMATYAYAVASNGLTVGQAVLSDLSGFPRGYACYWDETGAHLLRNLPSMATDVTDDGRSIVGWTEHRLSNRSRVVPFVSTFGALVLLTEPIGSVGTCYAYAISDDGQTVGGMAMMVDPTRPRTISARGIIWRNGQPREMEALEGGFGSQVNALSYNGRFAVGSASVGTDFTTRHATLWEDGAPRLIGSLGGRDSIALSIDGAGRQVVGSSKTAQGDSRAFYWTREAGIVALQDRFAPIIPQGWVLTSATAISPNGRYIVGVGINPAGATEAWMIDTNFECLSYNGDTNRDGCVDDADLLEVLFNFGATGNNLADANCDGIVDDADLLDVLFNFGSGC